MKFETNPEAKTITMRGGIGDFENHISADDFLSALSEHAGQDVTIHMDSPGGSVTDGLSMYNAICQYSGKVTIHIDSLAASIATVIAAAADHVIINSTGRMMVHRAWTMSMGNCTDFRSVAEVMEKMDEDIAATYAARTDKSAEDWMEIMDAETWFSASEALAAGLVDEVNQIQPKVKAEAAGPEIKAELPETNTIGPFWKAKIEATARRIRLKSRAN